MMGLCFEHESVAASFRSCVLCKADSVCANTITQVFFIGTVMGCIIGYLIAKWFQ